MSVLQVMAAPAFVLDASGSVKALNPAAQALLGADDRLRLTADRLHASAPREDELLCGMIVRATAPDTPSDSFLALRGAGGAAEPLVLDIAALPPGLWGADFKPGALVVARKPWRDRQMVAELLAQTYDLTPAEADIAEQLSRGVSREDAAQARGVSLGTVRIQIKAIFRKMEVSREGELVARVGLFR